MEFIISGSILFISTNPGENTTSIFSLGCLVSQLQIANNANTTIKCFILLGVSWGFGSIKRSRLRPDAAQSWDGRTPKRRIMLTRYVGVPVANQ